MSLFRIKVEYIHPPLEPKLEEEPRNSSATATEPNHSQGSWWPRVRGDRPRSNVGQGRGGGGNNRGGR